jgi:hypothetical protein
MFLLGSNIRMVYRPKADFYFAPNLRRVPSVMHAIHINMHGVQAYFPMITGGPRPLQCARSSLLSCPFACQPARLPTRTTTLPCGLFFHRLPLLLLSGRSRRSRSLRCCRPTVAAAAATQMKSSCSSRRWEEGRKEELPTAPAFSKF